MAKRDFYDVLGISKGSSSDEIKKAYRSLAKKYHPDVSSEPNAEEKFKEVQEAYATLSDDQKKAQYDQFGHTDGAGFGGGSGFGGFGGFGGGGAGFGGFEDILSSFFGGSTGGARNRSYRGEDIEMHLNITFDEAVNGVTKTIRVTVDEECVPCGGTGAYSKKDIKVCSKCNGSGSVIVEQQSFFGRTRTQQICPKCHGTGQEVTKKCDKCSGKGRSKKTKDVDVKIPAGIDNGMSVRMTGYGEAGSDGAPNGDLYITVKVKPHNVFIREGSDIYLEVPISFSQAALGDEIQVPTVNEMVKVKIPSGTQSGTKLRLRSKGVQNPKTGSKGDQIIIVTVETPTSLSKEEKDLFNKLGKINKKSSAWDKFLKKFKN